MIYLFLYFLVVSLFLFSRNTAIFRFDQFSTLSWLFATFLGSTGLIVHKSSLSFETIVLVIISHTFLVTAFHFSHVSTVNKPRHRRIDQISFNIMIYCTLIFIIFALVRSAVEGNIPILSASYNIEVNRADHWENSKGGIDRIVQILVYTSIPFLVIYPVLKKTKFLTIIYIFSLILTVDNAVLEGGRALIVFVMISVASVMFSVRKIKIGSAFIYAAVGLFSVYILASQFYLARNTSFGSNVEGYIQYNCDGGRLAAPVKAMPLSIQSLSLSSCYFSTPLHSFDRMRRDWNKRYNGAYNGGIIFGDEFSEAREEISNYFSSKRLAGNPWATSVRDFWLDIGYAAPLAFLIVGFVAGKIGKLGRSNSPTVLARYGLLGSIAFMMPYQSPFVLRYLIYSIIFTYLVELMVSLVLPYLKRTGSPRNPIRRHRSKSFEKSQLI